MCCVFVIITLGMWGILRNDRGLFSSCKCWLTTMLRKHFLVAPVPIKAL